MNPVYILLGVGALLLLGTGTAAAAVLPATNPSSGSTGVIPDGILSILFDKTLEVFGDIANEDPRYIRSLMAIMWQESQGNTAYVLGDTTLGCGPSIGLMQVYQKTALDYGLWSPPSGAAPCSPQASAEYASLADNVEQGIDWGVRVFKFKLAAQGGNFISAIRAYNGTGPMAEKYRQRAVAWAESHWGVGCLN